MKLRREFIYDPSLVLYLPLWKLDGTSFMSQDAYGRLCTATGTTWGITGRTSDGVDDIITCGNATSLIAVTGNFSLIMWVKPTSSTLTRDLINTRSAANTDGMAIEMAAGSLAPTAYFYVAGFTGTICNTALTLNAFNCFGISRSGNTITYYLAGIEKNNFTLAGAGTESLGNFQIGAFDSGTIVNEQAGIYGEVAKWNKTLTPAEFMNYYLRTKWRYA